ncbi:24141_t:CDS:2 [Dentiscutata erythropus]|uniref:24141_t:CDS:1 n=1 Tax=Dentiscutata erythropus TaxID=1348616 RepID=A0A9N9DNZ2_9GLOM|nr:24141_t:CDS:2 [Dentiscutata erythropus]
MLGREMKWILIWHGSKASTEGQITHTRDTLTRGIRPLIYNKFIGQEKEQNRKFSFSLVIIHPFLV